jgi:hypothetical protein
MRPRRSPLRPDLQVRGLDQKGARPKRDRGPGQQRLVRQAGLRHLALAAKTTGSALQIALLEADGGTTQREGPRETQRFDERADSAGSHDAMGPDRIGRLRAPLRPAGVPCAANPGLGPHGLPERSSSLPPRSRSSAARARVRQPRCKLLRSARRARRTGPEAVRRSDPPQLPGRGSPGDQGGSGRHELRSLPAPARSLGLALSAPESTPFELIFGPFPVRPGCAPARRGSEPFRRRWSAAGDPRSRLVDIYP